MVSTGSKDLDKYLNFNEKNKITAIYGEAGTGKTTLCLLAALDQALNNKKVIFIDSEKNFSIERIQQLLENKNKACINNILLLRSTSFNTQHTQIKNLENIKKISLIIIDSMTSHYRRLYRREPELAKGMLAKQLTILNKIAENNIPVIITSQVYSDLNNHTYPLAREIIKRFSHTLIKLKNNPKKIILKKPKKKSINFKIVNEGIIIK